MDNITWFTHKSVEESKRSVDLGDTHRLIYRGFKDVSKYVVVYRLPNKMGDKDIDGNFFALVIDGNRLMINIDNWNHISDMLILLAILNAYSDRIIEMIKSVDKVHWRGEKIWLE